MAAQFRIGRRGLRRGAALAHDQLVLADLDRPGAPSCGAALGRAARARTAPQPAVELRQSARAPVTATAGCSRLHSRSRATRSVISSSENYVQSGPLQRARQTAPRRSAVGLRRISKPVGSSEPAVLSRASEMVCQQFDPRRVQRSEVPHESAISSSLSFTPGTTGMRTTTGRPCAISASRFSLNRPVGYPRCSSGGAPHP